MSLDINYAKKLFTSFQEPHVKTPDQIEIERETFRSTQSGTSKYTLIRRIYEIISSIKDPEFPYTLEQLNVVNEKCIEVEEKNQRFYVNILWKPTNPAQATTAHLGMAIIFKLRNELSEFYQIKLTLSMVCQNAKIKKIMDKQLNDKERVTAAFENDSLLSFLQGLIN